MNEREGEEFYVGYLTHLPQGIGKLMRTVVIALFGIILLVVLMIVFGLQKLPLSSFEFGQEREFTGVIKALPSPTLLVREGNSLTQFLLVAAGKHGADVNEFDGKKVKLTGTRIFRDGITMLEIVNHSIYVEANSGAENLVVNDLGKFTLVGEIVDSKCYLGVMNPGNTKPHRECASLCISGGVPPMFIAHDEAGNKIMLLLESVEGTTINEEVLDFVAEPVEISGQVWRAGQQLTLRAELKNYRRIQ
jgi:hypothetical protein